MAKYIELTTETFDSTVAEGVSVVDFWAPWCGPCRMIAPVIEELAETLDGQAKVCKVNTDEQQELGQKMGIRSIPTVLIFKNGEVVDTLIGANSAEGFMKKITPHLGE